MNNLHNMETAFIKQINLVGKWDVNEWHFQFYSTKFVYIFRRIDDIRHLHQELTSPDVGMVIKEW